MGGTHAPPPAVCDCDDGPAFLHSGDAGDLIYALPAMREMAVKSGSPGGRFKIYLGNHDRMVRNPWTAKSSWSMGEFLKTQSYITKVLWTPQGHGALDGLDYFDCDPFRARLLLHFRPGRTITDYVAEVLGVRGDTSNRPWLEIDEPMHVDGLPVVVCRTERYRNYQFPWHQVFRKYFGKILFVGHHHEWETCCSMWGHLPFCETETVLDLARLIAGCRLFIGNQSLPLAIAEGFKQNVLMESWPKLPDTIWIRPNSVAWLNKPVPLPEIP